MIELVNMRKTLVVLLVSILLPLSWQTAQAVSPANSSAVPLAPPSVVPTTPTPAPVVATPTPVPVVATRAAQPVTGVVDYTYLLVMVGLCLCAGVIYQVNMKKNS